MSSAVFPALPGLTWNITRTPQFSTKIQQAVGGRRIAAAFQPYPIRKWTLEYEFLRAYTPVGGSPFTEWQTLEGFFNARQGSFDTFLFDDPEDDTATAMIFGTGNGSQTAFQLGRTLGGFFEFVYNVYGATFSGAPAIYNNAVLQTAGVDYNLSASGVVTFTSAPAGGHSLTWTGTFRWRCAFEQDATEFNMFAQHFWAAKSVSFLSVLGA